MPDIEGTASSFDYSFRSFEVRPRAIAGHANPKGYRGSLVYRMRASTEINHLGRFRLCF